MIIYLETNSIMAIAKGRNKELEDFVTFSSSYNPIFKKNNFEV
jgi:hypothetical protein